MYFDPRGLLADFTQLKELSGETAQINEANRQQANKDALQLAHGGAVGCESRVGQETVFSLTLPVWAGE